jgi:hypothetical protein
MHYIVSLLFKCSPESQRNINIIIYKKNLNFMQEITIHRFLIRSQPYFSYSHYVGCASGQQAPQNLTSSVSLFSPIIDAIKSKIHTTLSDATINALKAVGGGTNSSAAAAFIHPERGFLVYDVFVLDPSDNINRVIVDPGNRKVLSNQSMSLMAMMAMMHSSMGMMEGPGMMGHGMAIMGP